MKKVEEGRRKRGMGGEKKWEGWWKEETRVRGEHKRRKDGASWSSIYCT